MFGIWHFFTTIFTTVTFNGSRSGQTSIPLCLSGRGWDYDATGSAGKHCWRGLTNWLWAVSFLSMSEVSRERFKGRILNGNTLLATKKPENKTLCQWFHATDINCAARTRGETLKAANLTSVHSTDPALLENTRVVSRVVFLPPRRWPFFLKQNKVGNLRQSEGDMALEYVTFPQEGHAYVDRLHRSSPRPAVNTLTQLLRNGFMLARACVCVCRRRPHEKHEVSLPLCLSALLCLVLKPHRTFCK